jgi:hypothetical protein
MTVKDPQEQLVWESKVSAAVLGRGNEFVLIRLDGSDLAALAEARSRDFIYCGALGIIDGQPCAECSCPDAAFTMIAQEMAVEGRLRPKDDSVQWLTRLWELPDLKD